MDEKDVKYLNSLDTDRYTATDEEIAHTYHWQYAVSLAAVAVIVLAILVIPGLFKSATLPTANTHESIDPSNPACTTSPISTTTPANTTQPLDGIYCRVILSINPSVEFQLGEDGSVIDVVGLNDDGSALINGLDFAGLSFENATIIVVNRLIADNYINASIVQDNIRLSVSGETGQMDVLTVMSSVIQSAALQCNLNLETIQTEANQLKIVLAAKPEEPGDNELPPLKADELPVSWKLEFNLTGKKAPYSEVNDVSFTLEDGVKYPSSAILPHSDLGGASVGFTTLFGLHTLIEKGYISDQIGNKRILFSIPGYDDKSLAETMELTRLIFQEACLALDVVKTGAGEMSIVPSGLPAPVRTARYTMPEVLNVMILKSREDISDLQVQILTMALSPSEAESHLEPRYWAVIPNLIGLPEEEAIRLCEQAGFVPEAIREYNHDFTSADIGRVIFQDSDAGGTWEVGSKFLFFVHTERLN